jgi:hypothetical protein
MNDKKQLDCELNCKASASLSQSIRLDLQQEDKKLEELLQDETTENCNQATD